AGWEPAVPDRLAEGTGQAFMERSGADDVDVDQGVPRQRDPRDRHLADGTTSAVQDHSALTKITSAHRWSRPGSLRARAAGLVRFQQARSTDRWMHACRLVDALPPPSRRPGSTGWAIRGDPFERDARWRHAQRRRDDDAGDRGH